MNWLKRLIMGRSIQKVSPNETIKIVVGGKTVPLIYHTDGMEMVIEDGIAVIRPKQDKKQIIKNKTQSEVDRI